MKSRLGNFILLSLALAGATFAASPPLDEAAQKKQLDGLFTAALKVADEMIRKHGEFLPYGASINLEGKTGITAG
ncbi:MAG: hypothetical protein ABIR80_05775, partial [Opitutaceae bacterium]